MSLTVAALDSLVLRSMGTGGFLLVTSRAQPGLLHRLGPVATTVGLLRLFLSSRSSENRKPEASHHGVRTTHPHIKHLLLREVTPDSELRLL